MKIGNLELEDKWHKIGTGVYHKLMNNSWEICISLYDVALYKQRQCWNVLYFNSLHFLGKTDYAPHSYVGTVEEIKDHVDKFLLKISRIVVFY